MEACSFKWEDVFRGVDLPGISHSVWHGGEVSLSA